MKKKEINVKKIEKYIYMSFVLNTLMIFSELFPTVLVAGVQLLFVVWSLLYLSRYLDFVLTIVLLSISMIPISFVSLFGGSIETFPISWFHVLVLLAFVLVVLKGKVDKYYFIFLMLFVGYGVCNAIVQSDVADALKQILMMLLFYVSFFIGNYLEKKGNRVFFSVLYKLYLFGTLSVSGQVIIQYLVMNNSVMKLGTYSYMSGRTAFGGLMGDFSFATIYIGTGILATILAYFEYRTINLIKLIAIGIVQIVGIMLVTSRTGLYALVITLCLYMATHMRHFKTRYLLVIVGVCALAPVLIEVLIANRGGQNLLDGSGRIDGYLVSLESFKENVLFGCGFGLKNLYEEIGREVPHNFFLQYLTQTGLIGTCIIVAPFVRFVFKKMKSIDYTKWMLILVFISSMAVPDIMSSRFLYGVILVCQVSCCQDK